MVQSACGAIEHIGIAKRVEAPDLVHVAIAGQSVDRIFLGVGIEVPHQQDIRDTRGRLQGTHEIAQLAHLLQAGGVVATLAVTLVGIRTGSRATALALEVIHDQREALSIGGPEGLRQGRTTVDGRCVDLRHAHSLQLARLVNHRHLDGVGPDDPSRSPRRDGVRARTDLGIQGVDQVLCGHRVVLHLHQTDCIGVDFAQRFNDLRALAHKLGVVAGTAAAGSGRLPCHTRLSGLAIDDGFTVGERGEVVQHVEAGHFVVAPHRWHVGWTRVRDRVAEGVRVQRDDAVIPWAARRCCGRTVVDDTGD